MDLSIMAFNVSIRTKSVKTKI